MSAASVMFTVSEPRSLRRITATRWGERQVRITTDTSEETYLSIVVNASALGVADHLEHLAAELRRQHRHADGTAAGLTPAPPTPGPLLTVDQDRVEPSPNGSPVRPSPSHP